MHIEPLYEEFLTYLAVERNSAKLTVDSYRSDGRVFVRFLDAVGVAREVEAVTKQVLRQYIVWLRERGLQPATVARRIHSLRSFWNYLWDCEYADANPFRKLTLPKQSRRLPVYLSEDECRRLIAGAAQQASAFLACRDTALLSFLLFTGARRSEVLNLAWADVDLGQRTVRFVAAKGDKTRVLPLAEDAAEALAAWREVRPACGHEWVFTTQWGARLGRRGLTSALQRAMAAGGGRSPRHDAPQAAALVRVPAAEERRGPQLPAAHAGPHAIGHDRGLPGRDGRGPAGGDGEAPVGEVIAAGG